MGNLKGLGNLLGKKSKPFVSKLNFCDIEKTKSYEVDRYVTLSIPIKPHLKAYLSDFYELPYTLNQKDELGLFLYQLLRRRKFRDRKYFNIDQCSDQLTILVSHKYGFNQGCILLHDYQVHLFNCYLEDQLMKHAITWIRGAELAGLSNKAAIYKWIETYQLDDGSADWYHRIKKLYFRFRKSKKSGAPAVP